jgi:GT2 family glycosyltransferase
MKRIAVVILNWNGEKFLRQFLPGVVQHSEEVADVVVIDNASDDQSIALLRSEFPSVKIVRLDKNYGFAGGYNYGLREVPNEFYVLLNSDVEVTPQWIQPVVAYMDATPRMVACQPKILDFHRKEWFEYAGAAGGYIDKDAYAFCAGRVFYEFEKDQEQYNTNEEVFWASGAAMFIRRDVWIEVGGLDEDFFAHMEEIDLCWRLKNRGYKVGACRSAVVYHYGGGTLDRQSPFKTYLNFRNNLYMLVKNYHTSNLRLKLVRRMLLDGLAGIRFLTEGKWNHFTAVIKAHFSFYKNMKVLQRKRRKEELSIVEQNLVGVYNRSILKDFFLLKKRTFTSLDPRDFNH